MSIKQLTPVTQARLDVWFDALVNDPVAKAGYGDGRYQAPLKAPEDTWAKAMFMDDSGRGVLVLSFDRSDRTINVAIYVLSGEGRESVAAALFLRAIREAKKAQATHLTFIVNEHNEAWLKGLSVRFDHYRWGIAPFGFYRPGTDEPAKAHHFCIPVQEFTDPYLRAYNRRVGRSVIDMDRRLRVSGLKVNETRWGELDDSIPF